LGQTLHQIEGVNGGHVIAVDAIHHPVKDRVTMHHHPFQRAFVCGATIRMRIVLPHCGMFPRDWSLPHLKCALLDLEHDSHSLLTGCCVAEP
jgi:hypothetical protein